MRAVGAMEYGGPDKLQLIEIPRPHAKSGEVRIRVHAVPVVAVDISLRAGLFQGLVPLKPPYVPGMEAAGVISEVGAGSPWAIGDKVMTLASSLRPGSGAYADEIVVPAEWVVKMPEGVDFAHASTLPTSGLTARTALDYLGLRAGQTIAVTGSAGIVGGYVIQLAKADGLRVIADASKDDEKIVRDLGADEVAHRGNDFVSNIRSIAPDGVDGLVDTAVLNERVVPAIKDGGKLVLLRPWSGTPGRGIVASYLSLSLDDAASKISRLRKQVERGELTLRVSEVLAPASAAEAHRRFEAGGLRGRLVLDFS